jgi:glycolate oxidase FAD binding subunit
MTTRPQSVDDVQRIVRESQAMHIRGAGTKSAAVTEGDVLELGGALSGIVEYSPAECVFTAHAGTPVAEITAVLRENRQYLPFDPPFAEHGATIGGAVASGISGPRRYRYGGIRDFLIGVRIVDGEARLIRSGGKVVKNAAGFLLHHGVVGSCGRFGVITEVTFKVFPAPEARVTLRAACGSVEEAFAMAERIEQMRVDCESIEFGASGDLYVTLAGREVALDARIAKLAAVMGGQAEPAPTTPLALQPDAISVVKVAGLMESWPQLREHVTHAHFMCAGAVAWLSTNDLPRLSDALHGAGLCGQVIRGTRAGARVGLVVHNEFEERVRGVLDPGNRFRAASHSRH